MDLSNSLASTVLQSAAPKPASQTERRPALPPPGDLAKQNNNSSTPNAPQNDSRSGQSAQATLGVNQADYIKKGEAVQAERFLRDNSLENAPLKSQQAVSSYQQTIEAAKQYEEGELVGIDLFV
ncbi:MAG: hypothetical protein ACMZ64_04555 [Oleiphilus sp.]